MITFADVRTAVNLPDFDPMAAQLSVFPDARPEHRQPPPDRTPRQAGVLALIYPEGGALYVTLTRRTDELRGHSGQISFPGGKHDPHDGSPTATALRETCEELGICDGIEILGQLSTIYIPPSNFRVTPTVGSISVLPPLRPNPNEVAEVFGFALDDLLDARCKQEETWALGGVQRRVRFYQAGKHKVWGATAIMLAELEYRLRVVLLGTSFENRIRGV